MLHLMKLKTVTLKWIFFSTLCLFLISFTQAQVISSNTYIRTCLNKIECSSISNSSTLFYDENKAGFYLLLDFNNFKTGEDSLDDWLKDLTETSLYYKVSFPPENFLGLSNNKQKNFTLNGQTYLNGIWKNQSIELSLYSSENSVTSATNIGNKYHNYKVNFSLSIVPKDFNIHKKCIIFAQIFKKGILIFQNEKF